MSRICRLGLTFSLSFALLLALVGCATTERTVNSIASTEQGSGNDQQYVIGAGDTLNIFVWRNPEFTITVPVRPDGKISVPLVEDLIAAGRTPTELARDIEAQFKHYIRDPVVTVIVTNFVGLYGKQIRILGAANKPQSLPYSSGMTLLDVMIAVGGLTEFADGNKAKLVRQEGSSQIETVVRVEDLIQNGDIKSNVKMQPGDILIIPESWF